MDAPSRRPLSTLLRIVWFVLLQTSFSYANHGPGASGGGSATISGETLKQGHFELALREDVTSFQTFSTSDAIRKAQAGGDFDALDHSFVTTAELSYGIT